ncbi:putative acetyltransferase [compost metagenome]
MEGIRNKINGRGGAIIVRDDESVPVGTAIYYFEQDYMYIGRVAVIPSHRGLGIGLSLLAFLEEKAQRKGCFKTRVGVRLSLPENIEWYRRLGYVPVEEREYPDQTDRWYVMLKELA